MQRRPRKAPGDISFAFSMRAQDSLDSPKAMDGGRLEELRWSVLAHVESREVEGSFQRIIALLEILMLRFYKCNTY